VVLFFNAAWCSTCKIARDNFEASLDQIPSDLTVVVVDFDDSSELRKKYGVTLQHTFVQIDGMGEMVKKWSGSTSIEQIVNQTI
jgi:thiol-disulfide isomerase/thioredoxin